MTEKVRAGKCNNCQKVVEGWLGEKVTEDGVVEETYYESFCGKACRDAFRVDVLEKMSGLLGKALFDVVYPILGGTNVRVDENGEPLTNEALMQYIDDEVREKWKIYQKENLEARFW